MKKTLSILLCLCAVFEILPTVYAVDSGKSVLPEASAVLEETALLSNVDAVVMGTDSTVTSEVKGARRGWLLNSSLGTSAAYINIDLNSSFAYAINDGSSFDVEVDYYDSDNSVFGLVYDSTENSVKEGELVYLGMSQKWKTHTFTVDDAYFGNRLDGKYDLRICIRSNKINRVCGNVVIGGIRVIRHTAMYPLKITALKSDMPGNIFGSGEEKLFHIELENLTDKEVTGKIRYTITGDGENVLSSEEKEFTAAAAQRTNMDYTADCSRYGIFKLKAELICDISDHKKTAPFSFVYNDEDGSKNEQFGINIHYNLASRDVMVVVDLAGNKIEGNFNPSTDTPTHLELYKRFPEIGGITHTHSRWTTIFSQCGLSIPVLGTTHADTFYGNIPCTRKMTDREIFGEYEVETGKLIADLFTEDTISQIPGALVHSHGSFSWGKNAVQSVENAMVLEEVAMMAWHTLMLKFDVKFQRELLDKHYFRKHGKSAYYGQKGEK